ncbi:MAG: DoxX family protein [Kofleriaceae bacterium]
MRHLAPISRVLLGLVFLAFGINYFVPYLPPQPPPPPEAMGFIVALVGSKLLTLVKLVEIAAALALLSNRFVPLALALLAPIIVGIVFFHVMLVPAGLPIAIGLVVLELVLAWSYRSAFAPMLRAKVAPDPIAHRVRVPALAVP